jgi:polyisoprenoid-binding protein YceI
MTTTGILRPALLGLASCALSTAAMAASMTYEIDPNHTHPTFETDHMGGLSVWRGIVNASGGKVMLDKAMGTGSVEVTMDMSTIDVGVEALNNHIKTADMLDVEKFPTATYSGRLTNFKDGAPTAVEGQLTMHGVTKPVNLTINSFVCKEVRGRETCGADASATFDRSDFGVDFGAPMGFKMGMTLRIQVEAAVAQ